MLANFKKWRESASIIIVAKNNFLINRKSADCNYKLLTMKRSSKSSFMPDAYVFPGGNISKADSSKEWLKLYENLGFKASVFQKLKPNENFDFNQNITPKFLSLRINAIRETFEECGILICKSNKIDYDITKTCWASFVGGNDIKKWQDKVHDNPEQFLKLCTEFEVYPDIWALKEWSNWLTPIPMPSKFNATFFLAAFNQMPPIQREKKEVQCLEWSTPDEYLKKNLNNEIFFPPPQFYEINRLRNFNDIETLLNFAENREIHGCEMYLPHQIKADEGLYTILPGDDLYPDILDITNEDIPSLKDMPKCNVCNRILHKLGSSSKLIVNNYTPKYNQIAPLDYKHKL